MKKNKRQIGFLRNQRNQDHDDIDMDDQPANDAPSIVSDILNALFAPALSIQDADELLTTTDIMQSVSQNCDTSKSVVFLALKDAGFRSESIDNTLYWLTKYPS